MAQKTRTWTDLVLLTEARLGLDLSPEDKSRLEFLLNSAARIMYEDSPFWERFLVVEEREVVNGYVPFQGDSYIVSGAGTAEVNGFYIRNGDYEGRPAYSKFVNGSATHSICLYSFQQFPSTKYRWGITSGSPGGFSTDAIYYVDLPLDEIPQTEVPTTGWIEDTGSTPTPVLLEGSYTIGEYIGHYDYKGSLQTNAYVDAQGIRIVDCPNAASVVMAYKKDFNVTYGDGAGGTTTDVPAEWFDAMAYHAARSYRASQAQPDGYNPIALADVRMVMDQALMKVSRQGIYNTIARRYKTQYGEDNSVR